MNFLDTYGITGTGTSTPPPSEQEPEQSLNEEVSQVIGQLGRLWGGFRKQSEVALSTARRDFGQVVTQAQREIERLTLTEEQPDTSGARGQAEAEGGEEESDAEGTPTTDTTRPASTEPGGEASASGSSSTTTATHSFFARLQSSIPPNIVSAVQAQLPDGLRNAQNIDLAHLGSTLSSEFQRVQGVTRAQAEEYVHKSEALLREAMKEAGDVLWEAVRVIPPEEGSTDAPVAWDGADIWMLPSLAANADGSTTAGSASKGKGREVDSGPSSGRRSEDLRRAVATRAESLLKQLRSNPEIIKLDPAMDTSRDTYLAWADASEASGEGFGTRVWGEHIAEALSDPSDGAALQATFDALVPSSMPEEVFWVRYFFRVHQIEAEESRRKALLQATAENEDDFSWEDDEDESVSASDMKEAPTSAIPLESSQHTLAPPRTTSTSDVLSLPSSHVQSPRESSDDSYDVVSGNVSSTGAVEAEGEEEGEEEEEDGEEEDGRRGRGRRGQ
ncbi:hypothetical protein J3R83DRAFT_4156 [Lanmaoa asiatica]|nr:hypothetical protein J3R83DRAFT_4156 [Lanmaoa asiatica]